MRTRNSVSWGIPGGVFPISVVLVLGVLLHTNVVSAQNTTGDGTPYKSPVDKGLEPVYVMTKYFLDLVQPSNPSDSPLIAQLDLENLPKNLEQDWQTYSKFYVGYAACVIVGIVFIVLMPLIGCCICCCRCCCGNCGGGNREEDEMDGKHSKCQRWTFGIILIIVTTVMLGGTVVAFITNEVLRVRTQPSTGVLNNVSNTVSSLETYLDTIGPEVKVAVLDRGYDPAKLKIFTGLDNVASSTLDQLGKLTNAGPLLKQADDLAKRVTLIKADLDKTKASTTALVTYGKQLKTQLDSLKSSIQGDVGGCFQQVCNDLKVELNKLDVSVDFSKVDNVTAMIDKVQAVLSGDITKKVQEGYSAYQNITNDIKAGVQGKIDDAKSEAEKIRKEIEKAIDDSIIKTIKNLNLSMEVEPVLKELRPMLEEYGDYRWYAGLAISCVLLLIILLNYMGLAFGACGKRPYDDASSCNKGVGANLLLASVTFIFLFSWLLMLITMVLFMGGGTLHTEVCRQIVKPEDPKSFSIIDDVLKGIKEAKNFTDTIGSAAVLLANTMKNCKANQGLAEAADAEKLLEFVGYNLTKILSPEQYGLDKFISQLKNTTFNIPTVDIITTDMKTSLTELSNTGIDSIDFNSFLAELNKTITSVSLDKLKTDLSDAANALRSSDASLASRLDTHVTTITDMQNNVYKKITDEMVKLRAAVIELQKDANIKSETQALITGLETAENNVNSRAAILIKQIVSDQSDSIEAEVRNALQVMKAELFKVGPCRPVYNAYMSAVGLVCIDVLDPFNAFWYAIGWNLFFFIPSIIFSLLLVSLYRKIEPYSDKSAFDDPRFDEYTGMYPGDNMPLEQHAVIYRWSP